MKKKYRVKKNEEFQQIFKQGESFANKQLVIYYVMKKDQQHFRVGISVGKKLGNAVMRNKIKRYIRESLRQLEPHIQPDVDFVIIARKPATSMNVEEVKISLKHLLKRTGLYRQ
ncbi:MULTISPECIES: ribonuclease P protein component [Allobacillus]|uniref:Ribonuclease P protein component n=1 Tax=Allobacillus salarius TaxID=1955272 RepID=A0A556PGB3_9BACI|nr:ribonuclease P protein component [Allobacillus salarius]TSJ63426.1 ribonuclease P protein component [Allobacillus salarius]